MANHESSSSIIARMPPEETRAWLAAIVDSSDDAIVSKNLESVVTTWNAGAEQLFGYSAAEMIGQSIIRIIPKELIAEESEILARIRRGDRVEHFETVRIAKDGRRIHVSLTISPIKDITGRVVGASKIARDITKRKEIEAALQQATAAIAHLNQELESRVRDRTAELEEATAALKCEMEQQNVLQAQLRQAQKMESIGTLAGGIAHDFNNILNIIVGYAVAVSGEADPSRVADNIAVIKEAVERGARVVQQLLAVGRKTPVSFEAADLNRLLEDHAILLQGSFPKTIDISLRLDSCLAPVAVDANRLDQAILNLCVNARDAMNGAGKLVFGSGRIAGSALRARFADAVGESYVWISVSDNGPGIERTTMDRIFEPFFTTKGQGEGSGLGLAVVYGIVKDHGGFIGVESEPDRGTTFCLYLPERRAEVASDRNSLRPEAPPPAAPRGITVLLADDEEKQLRLMERVLIAAGYNVLTARDGIEAVEIYRRNRGLIAVAVLDLELPRLSGWQSYCAMKTIDSGVKVLFASGYVDPQIKAKVENSDNAAIITKPYKPEELVAQIGAIAKPSGE